MAEDENYKPTVQDWLAIAVKAKAGNHVDRAAWWNAFEPPLSTELRTL